MYCVANGFHHPVRTWYTFLVDLIHCIATTALPPCLLSLPLLFHFYILSNLLNNAAVFSLGTESSIWLVGLISTDPSREMTLSSFNTIEHNLNKILGRRFHFFPYVNNVLQQLCMQKKYIVTLQIGNCVLVRNCMKCNYSPLILSMCLCY